MRKLFLIVLSAIFLMGGIAFAAEGPYYENVQYLGGHGDIDEPPMYVVKVRYARGGSTAEANLNRLKSGTVVVWDNNSRDGVTVSMITSAFSHPCGVLVTDLLTDDNTTLDSDDDFGYMCVYGYCLASIDASACSDGGQLVPSITLAGHFDTVDTQSQVAVLSADCGILLDTPGASDTSVKVWLNLM